MKRFSDLSFKNTVFKGSKLHFTDAHPKGRITLQSYLYYYTEKRQIIWSFDFRYNPFK